MMERGKSPQVGVMQIRIIVIAMMLSILVYAVAGILVCQAVPPTLDQRLGTLLGVVLVAAGVVSSPVSFLLKRVMTAGAPGPERMAAKTRAVIVALAIAEAPAVMGLVHIILSGMFPYAIVLWVLSFLLGVAHFPRRDWLEG